MVKINKSQKLKKIILSFFFLMICSFSYGQVNQPPLVTAEGKQAFCPGNPINIVTYFSITDLDNTTIESFFIQISSGYQVNFDYLELTGNHPNINSEWNNIQGKLSLTSSISGTEILLTDIENAVKAIVFSTTSNNITIEKTFSLTIDDTNYLPATDHFYQFISDLGITWSEAKIAAENKMYYGRTGYLATLTSKEEADFAGEQASGAGWIGGSDKETEGVWRWETGPETGTIFWNGKVSGSTPNYANWNNNEPNDYREINPNGEHYAHITDPSIGIRGAWNDLPNEGGTDLYIAKGYVVEYGVPTDPSLNIAASTSIYIPQITATTDATICVSGTATISATASEGTILWYTNKTGGNSIANGKDFTTSSLTSNTTYFTAVSVDNCTTLERTPIEVIVNQKPTITNVIGDLICSGSATLTATSSAGIIYWYNSLTSTTPLFTGNTYQTISLTTTTKYYIEANIDNCISSSRAAVIAEVNSAIPKFDLVKDTYFLCTNSGSVAIETTNWLDNYNYVWKKENVIISGSLATKNVNSSGNYSVTAISLSGCESAEKQIIVRNSNIATITNSDVILVEDSDNNSIEVINNNLGIGEYEFSLDHEFGIYKDASLFEKTTTGMHTLFVKDKNGCGITPYQFSIFAFPKFFTPNGDGKNDVWKIDGFNSDSFTIAEISIYNRFGVLLYQIESSFQSWDGTYQGKILPSNTYWFRMILNDVNDRKIEKTGSIGLIRK